MCLSDAYELVGGERKPLMNYVSAISVGHARRKEARARHAQER